MNFESFTKWFATSPIASFLRVFVAMVVFQATEDFSKFGAFDFSNLERWAVTAFVSAIPTILRWLNPSDYAFGNNKAG